MKLSVPSHVFRQARIIFWRREVSPRGRFVVRTREEEERLADRDQRRAVAAGADLNSSAPLNRPFGAVARDINSFMASIAP